MAVIVDIHHVTKQIVASIEPVGTYWYMYT